MNCICRLISESIAYIFRDKKIERKISVYQNLTLEQRNELHHLLLLRSNSRELKLLIYQVLVVYATGTAKEREDIENWLNNIGAFNALKEIQKKFVTNTLRL
jgi:hypothetical protein